MKRLILYDRNNNILPTFLVFQNSIDFAALRNAVCTFSFASINDLSNNHLFPSYLY